MYNTVFIDWYQTLSISTFWSHLTDSHHKNHALYEPLRRALFEEQNQVFEGWLVGNINSERVMEILAQHTGIPYELIWDEFVVGFQHQSLVSEDIYDFIRDLRMSGVKVAIATDNMDCFNRWCVPALKLDEHFDDILNSFNIGHLKKEIAGKRSLFFEAYLERNNIGPGGSILFDDSPNVEPATIIAGIEYCRIRSRNGLVTELQRLCENL